MSALVADSSVLAKLVIAEADSEHADRVLSARVQDGSVVTALDIALVEVANAVWKQFIRGNATSVESEHALSALMTVSLRIEPALSLLPSAMETAIRYRIPIYDALFVALVVELKADGITADEPLVNVVRRDLPQIKLLRDW